MKQKYKKIIAREFLFLLGGTIFFIVMMFVWSSKVDANSKKRSELNQKIENLTAFNKLPFRLKVYYYIKNEINDYYWNKENDRGEFLSDVKGNDKASKVYDYIKKNGTIDIDRQQFFDNISKDYESDNYLIKIISLERELEVLKNSIFYDRLGEKPLALLLILFFILFILRYIIYATKWSLKQLH